MRFSSRLFQTALIVKGFPDGIKAEGDAEQRENRGRMDKKPFSC